jgi:hypothetical protein
LGASVEITHLAAPENEKVLLTLAKGWRPWPMPLVSNNLLGGALSTSTKFFWNAAEQSSRGAVVEI